MNPHAAGWCTNVRFGGGCSSSLSNIDGLKPGIKQPVRGRSIDAEIGQLRTLEGHTKTVTICASEGETGPSLETDPRPSLFGHYNLIDNVDDAIIRNDISLYDVGVVHADFPAFHAY